jgi:choline kinase
MGNRLSEAADRLPKALLQFGGKSLLERHIEGLRALGFTGVEIVLGFRADAIEAELQRLDTDGFVTKRYNPDYHLGSVVSLWVCREALAAGEAVVQMDADVLCDNALISRLVASKSENCFLMDRTVETGEEPVKLFMRDDVLVDFGKPVRMAHDYYGEWPGFVRYGPDCAARIAAATQAFVDAGRHSDMYEEAMREVLLASPEGTFGIEDVTGLPWIEIDFQADLERAHREILPQLAG